MDGSTLTYLDQMVSIMQKDGRMLIYTLDLNCNDNRFILCNGSPSITRYDGKTVRVVSRMRNGFQIKFLVDSYSSGIGLKSEKPTFISTTNRVY